MGITLLTFSGLFAPLQHFVGWLASAPQRQRVLRPVARVARPAGPAGVGAGRSSWRPAGRNALPARRPLRVVRVVDGCHAPASAGRMVISGRMADVCAELERLAALEAQAGGGRHQARAPIR
ncbi:MAG: hypothetical protein H7322_04235 [Ramlibacter sp.]|nr:hypothetical protein [Ramlibacter sp.]